MNTSLSDGIPERFRSLEHLLASVGLLVRIHVITAQPQYADDDQAIATVVDKNETVSKSPVPGSSSRKKRETHAIAALIPGIYLGASWDLKMVPPLIPPMPPHPTNKALVNARFHCPRTLLAW